MYLLICRVNLWVYVEVWDVVNLLCYQLFLEG